MTTTDWPDPAVKAALNDRQAFALTVYGEARGERQCGREAVAAVVRNRLRTGRWGKSYHSVCLWPAQFSCWWPNGGLANYAVVMAMARCLLDDVPTVLPASLRACIAIADKAMAETLEDPTGQATHYLTEALYSTHPPAWALRLTMTTKIGAHVFFA